MPLATGTKLGPYELQSQLGAGGMGEVYRACDPRLGRNVAVKILPNFFAGDTERLRRFELEARTVAALNHPNILSIHDIGRQDGVHYLVTELLQGSTLRQKLRNGPLGARRATDYAIQIAQGLAAAHEKGIVHRDLKPENIFITDDGHVKILDFGLAKRVEHRANPDGNTTLAEDFTSAGILLGTVGYMSPEQVRGDVVDARTDIFAFGSVLYEMLSGLRAFQRDSSAETMTAILKQDPPEFGGTGTQIPLELQRVVSHCLEKDPKRRFQSARDLSFALENIGGGSSATRPREAPAGRRAWMGWKLATIVLAVALLATVAAWLRSAFVSPPAPKFNQVTFKRGAIGNARFTPDGHTLVYSAGWEGNSPKFFSSRDDGTDVRDLDLQGEIQAISHLRDLAIILDNGTLARVPLTGGTPREVVEDAYTADWSPDGAKLAVASPKSGKCYLEYPIGKPLYESLGFLTNVRVSPQGDAIAFMEHPMPGDDRGSVGIVDLNGKKRTLTEEFVGEYGLAWSTDGSEILFTASNNTENDRDLYAVTRTGKQRLVYRAPGGVWLEDVADDGRVLLKHQERRYEVTVGDIGGSSHFLSSLQLMVFPSLSRDGKYAVMTDMSGIGGKDYHIYLAKLDGSPAEFVGIGTAGGISPDNKWVASIVPSDTTRVVLLPTGVGDTKTVTAPNFIYSVANWTRDGNNLVVRASQSHQPIRFWIQSIHGGAPKPVTPDGLDNGVFLSLLDADYVGARDAKGTLTLYPVDGSAPFPVAGSTPSDTFVAGSPSRDEVFVSPNPDSIPEEIQTLNYVSGVRRHFASVSPTDTSGLLGFSVRAITPDQKKYVATQYRQVSILYVASGLH